MDLMTIVLFVVVFILVFLYRKAQKPSGLPPGPPTSIFTGNRSMLVHNKSLQKSFLAWKKKYGPIYSLQLGWYPAVVISGEETIRDAFVKNADQFSHRATHPFIMKLAQVGDKGIVMNSGESLKASKRLALTSLRDFGVGKPENELKVIEEAEAVLEAIGKHNGEPFQFGNLFSKATCNVICSVLFGSRNNYDSAEFIALLENMDAAFQHNDFIDEMMLPPCALMSMINPKSFKMMEHWNGVTGFINNRIKEHRQSFDADNIRDFVDIYLKAEQQQQKNSNKSNPDEDPVQATLSFWATVSNQPDSMEKNIAAIIMDLLAAGTESTATTLNWAMAYMITQPHIQDKCRDFIHSVVGKSRRVNLKDRQELPYIEATLCEVQRIGSIVPQAVLHCTNGPVRFHGYDIPDKTIVIPDIYTTHMDPEAWVEPEKFNPDRFLGDKGQLVKPTAFMPFSVGRRSCPGDGLAKTELFLIFTTLIQHYKLTAPDVSKVPTVKEAVVGFTLAPPPYDVIATPVD